jgi:hypothetical protein
MSAVVSAAGAAADATIRPLSKPPSDGRRPLLLAAAAADADVSGDVGASVCTAIDRETIVLGEEEIMGLVVPLLLQRGCCCPLQSCLCNIGP